MGGQAPVDPDLSEKRRQAGRRGAASRWSNHRARQQSQDWRQGIEAWRANRPKNALRFKVENAAGDGGSAEMYIYDEIVDSFLASMGWGVCARDVITTLASITADQITLHLNSPGGDVFEAHAIYNALRNHDAELEVIVDGLAASAASYIAQAGDKVVVESNAQVMIHDAIGFTYGNAADHQQQADLLGKLSDGIADIYSDRAGGTRDDWRAAMQAETWYSADEAVAAGLADEVANAGSDDSAKNSADTRVYGDAARHTMAPGPAATSVPDRADPPSGPAGDAGTAGDDEIDVASITSALEGAFA